MPVNTPHDDYARELPKWTRCRDCFEGQDAIKAKRDIYLPRLGGQAPLGQTPPQGGIVDVYDAYLQRAFYYNAVAPTVVGLTGAVFIKPLNIENKPDILEALFADVTLNAVPLELFAREMVGQVILPGRFGVLVDMPVEGQTENPRPYWVGYRAEQIINWRTKTVAGKKILTLVVLKEVTTAATDDPFVDELVTRYRVLLLNANNQYEVSIWVKAPNTTPGTTAEWVQSGPAITPTRRGVPLEFIPFVFVGPEGNDPSISDCPMLPLVDVNISLYMSSADKEWGEHFTALPTPVVTGYSTTEPIHIGSTRALVLTDPQAQAFYMEFSGEGMGSLRESIKEKREMMASLGARLLEQPSVQETATAVRMRHAGEHASLTTIANASSDALSKCAQWSEWWLGAEKDFDEDLKVKLNTDFLAVPMSSEDAKAMMLLWQAGGVSYDTFFFNMQRGGLIPPGRTLEEEKALREAEAPELPEPEPEPEPGPDDE
jgi:hypothetical protein